MSICPAGTYASGGASECSPCGADNKYSAAGSAECSTCPVTKKTIGGTQNTHTNCVNCHQGSTTGEYIGHYCDGSSESSACEDKSFITEEGVHVTWYPKSECMPSDRTVNIETQSGCPTCTVVGAPKINLNVGGTYSDTGAECRDADGNILNTVFVVDQRNSTLSLSEETPTPLMLTGTSVTVDTSAVGTHVFTYRAQDSSGKWSYGCGKSMARREVHVWDCKCDHGTAASEGCRTGEQSCVSCDENYTLKYLGWKTSYACVSN